MPTHDVHLLGDELGQAPIEVPVNAGQHHTGAVGYFYQQLTADSGASPILGDFKSRVAGIGPQIGFIFPVGNMQGYLNFKGYKEFDAENRPEGWNAWVTFAISPAAATPPTPQSSLARK